MRGYIALVQDRRLVRESVVDTLGKEVLDLAEVASLIQGLKDAVALRDLADLVVEHFHPLINLVLGHSITSLSYRSIFNPKSRVKVDKLGVNYDNYPRHTSLGDRGRIIHRPARSG